MASDLPVQREEGCSEQGELSGQWTADALPRWQNSAILPNRDAEVKLAPAATLTLRPDPRITSGVSRVASGSCRGDQPPPSSLHPSPSGALPLRAGYPRRKRGWAPAHRATRREA